MMVIARPRGGLDNPQANGPRLLLADHHQELEAAFVDLRAAAMCDDTSDLVETYRIFERGVLAHIAAEDEQLLPGYERYAPADAARIRIEHRELREQLFALALEVQLHCVRLEELDALIGRLRAHARREDFGIYPWAQVHLPLDARRRLFVRLARSLRELFRARESRSPDRVAG